MKELKPFVKWAGGKTQLLDTFNKMYPKQLASGQISTYIEPFVGAGAVFFDIIQRFPSIKRTIICDVNIHLINAWKCIQKNVNRLISLLKKFQEQYYKCLSDNEKSIYFNKVRDEFNSNPVKNVRNYLNAAQFIFLNKTCFNGLYRVNSRGDFNVPFANPKAPLICDESNLIQINKILKSKKTKIICSSFDKIGHLICKNSFTYFDPPYRPIKLDSFVSYDKSGFNDKDQIKLANFFSQVSKLPRRFCMLSNSDPKNTNPNDIFFDDLYKEFNINRINAKRMINSKGNSRGNISELLIRNYE